MSYMDYGARIPCSMCGKFTSFPEPCDCMKGSGKGFSLDIEVGVCSICGFDNRSGGSKCNCSGKVLKAPPTYVVMPSKAATKPSGLEELYNELGKLKWTGSDKGWDEAIEAVRSYIKEGLK